MWPWLAMPPRSVGRRAGVPTVALPCPDNHLTAVRGAWIVWRNHSLDRSREKPCARPSERLPAMRFGLFGCGRIGRVHADSVAHHPRAELAMVYDPIAAAGDEVAATYGGTATTDVGRHPGRRQHRRGRHRLPHLDPRRPADPRGPRRQGGALREADRSRSGTGRRVLVADRRSRRHDHARLQPPIRSDLPLDARAHRRRRDRHSRATDHHQPRPGARAAGLHRHVGRVVPRHDHPRLRPGPVLPRRGRRGVRGGREPVRALHRGRGRHRQRGRRAARCERCAGPHHQLRGVRSSATTSGSRSSGRPGC